MAALSSLNESARALLEWYEHVISRRVDIIGDYAGNEPFLIEGDSLLLHCFSDPRINFEGKTLDTFNVAV